MDALKKAKETSKEQERKSRKVYAFDIETTGMKYDDTEIAHISIVKFDLSKKEYTTVYDQKFTP